MLVVVSLELQVFHEISWIYQNSQDCLENSLNPKLFPKFPRSWKNSQAVAALSVSQPNSQNMKLVYYQKFKTTTRNERQKTA